MEIARHWVRVDGTERTPDGQPRHLIAWGWSSSAATEAESVARSRLGALMARVRQGLSLERGYGYSSRPIREEILEELSDADGPSAVVTRNGYGALVLNARGTLFLDVDMPPPSLGRIVGPLFGRARRPEEDVLHRLRSTLARDGGSYRVYRTAAGFRVLATDVEVDPTSAAVRGLMETTGTDPWFIRLCGAQRSFRSPSHAQAVAVWPAHTSGRPSQDLGRTPAPFRPVACKLRASVQGTRDLPAG